MVHVAILFILLNLIKSTYVPLLYILSALNQSMQVMQRYEKEAGWCWQFNRGCLFIENILTLFLLSFLQNVGTIFSRKAKGLVFSTFKVLFNHMKRGHLKSGFNFEKHLLNNYLYALTNDLYFYRKVKKWLFYTGLHVQNNRIYNNIVFNRNFRRKHFSHF